MPECLPSLAETEPSDHSSLNIDFGPRSFWTIKITYVCWISFPRIKLAASCCPTSPEPRQKRTLSTFQRKYLNIELTPELASTHSSGQAKPSGLLRFAHLGPDTLYPWRPDGICLLANLPVHVPDSLAVNKHLSLIQLFPLTVLLHVGQIYFKENDQMSQKLIQYFAELDLSWHRGRMSLVIPHCSPVCYQHRPDL
ncbi:hypothetical protein ATANTOWER_004169 [Ataeniobius toweri]|uniref:Uncharacterized protein n=1 Tax=Ataeniobius toweri TaxID=208326 RepID=A0ABU7AM01_9TELE|nr:hypothetical protein [Ataeniobius toweri]